MLRIMFSSACAWLFLLASHARVTVAEEGTERLIPLPRVALAHHPPRIRVAESNSESNMGRLSKEEIERAVIMLGDMDVSEIPWEYQKSHSKWFGAEGASSSAAHDDASFLRTGAVRDVLLGGPDSIPVLLLHLNDRTPTDTSVVFEQYDKSAFATMYHGNPANVVEQKLLSLGGSCYSGTMFDGGSFVGQQTSTYKVLVGDVCLVLLGEIVGRNYGSICVCGKFETAIVSPVYNPEIAQTLSAVWEHGANTRQYLLESLLLDFSTRGICDGCALDGCWEGHQLQLMAVPRLLQFFPEETRQCVADRVTGLRFSNDEYDDILSNGIDPVELLNVLRPFKHDVLARAISRVRDSAVSGTVRDLAEEILSDWSEQ